MEIKDILNKLNENFEETINVSMTIDVEGEMVISENNGLLNGSITDNLKVDLKAKTRL